MSKQAVVLYLHVHQPYRVRPYTVFDTAHTHDYFDAPAYEDPQHNEAIFRKVADKSYRPMNELLRTLLLQNPEFKISLSITGTFIEQAEMWAPDVLDSFKQLVDTGRVEILGETYHHSLAFFYSLPEFERQVSLHRQTIERVFSVTPRVFRNTELAYDDTVAEWVEKAGYKGVLAEGWDSILAGRSANHPYKAYGTNNLGLLLKNYQLSDDIAFRFSNQAWNEWPLTAEKYTAWLSNAATQGPLVNLFMDYETFGEHQWEDTGIFTFFNDFVATWLGAKDRTFYTVSEAFDSQSYADEVAVPHTTTWADKERDLSAWNGNSMQRESLRHLYALEHDIIRTNNTQLIDDWRKLQASDLVYYMSTKWLDDGDVHSYFSPYDSPYDAFLYYMNVIRDLRWRLMADHGIGRLHV